MEIHKCPDCGHQDWEECEPYCDDCGNHFGVRCTNCNVIYDHVWDSDNYELVCKSYGVDSSWDISRVKKTMKVD